MRRYLQSKVNSYIEQNLNQPHYTCLLFTQTYHRILSLNYPSCAINEEHYFSDRTTSESSNETANASSNRTSFESIDQESDSTTEITPSQPTLEENFVTHHDVDEKPSVCRITHSQSTESTDLERDSYTHDDRVGPSIYRFKPLPSISDRTPSKNQVILEPKSLMNRMSPAKNRIPPLKNLSKNRISPMKNRVTPESKSSKDRTTQLPNPLKKRITPEPNFSANHITLPDLSKNNATHLSNPLKKQIITEPNFSANKITSQPDALEKRATQLPNPLKKQSPPQPNVSTISPSTLESNTSLLHPSRFKRLLQLPNPLKKQIIAKPNFSTNEITAQSDASEKRATQLPNPSKKQSPPQPNVSTISPYTLESNTSLLHPSRFKRLLFYIHYVLFSLASFSTILNLLFVTSQDYHVFYLQYFIAFYCFMIFIDYNVYLLTYEKRKQLLADIAHHFIKSGRTSRECLTSEVWFSLVTSALLATSYVMFMVQPFLIDAVSTEEMAVYNRTYPKRRYSVEFLTGFDYSRSPYYEMGFLFVMYTGLNIQVITFDTVTTLPILSLHIKGQLEIISSYLRIIGNDSVSLVDIRKGTITRLHCTDPHLRHYLHSACTKHLLTQLIRHHQRVTRIITQFTRIHQPVFGLRIFLSTTLLLGILCQYAFTNNTHILFVATNMATILQFNFFFNSSSEMLHSGYARVHAALIENNWYRSAFSCCHGNQRNAGCYDNDVTKTRGDQYFVNEMRQALYNGCHSNPSHQGDGKTSSHSQDNGYFTNSKSQEDKTKVGSLQTQNNGCHSKFSNQGNEIVERSPRNNGCHRNLNNQGDEIEVYSPRNNGCHSNLHHQGNEYKVHNAQDDGYQGNQNATCCCHGKLRCHHNRDIVQLLSVMLTFVNHRSGQYLTFCQFHKIGFVNFVRCLKSAYSIFVILFRLSQN